MIPVGRRVPLLRLENGRLINNRRNFFVYAAGGVPSSTVGDFWKRAQRKKEHGGFGPLTLWPLAGWQFTPLCALVCREGKDQGGVFTRQGFRRDARNGPMGFAQKNRRAREDGTTAGDAGSRLDVWIVLINASAGIVWAIVSDRSFCAGLRLRTPAFFQSSRHN